MRDEKAKRIRGVRGAMVQPSRSLTVGLFGDAERLKRLGSALGKKGTESDLRFWNKKERGIAVTALAPVSYPERIVPMLQVASLCDVPVLVAGDLDAAFAETVLSLQAYGKKGLFILANRDTAERARGLVKDRLPHWIALEGMDDEAIRRFRNLVLDWDVTHDATGTCTVSLDHAFAVRGVGTVALGFVRRGTLRVHDELRVVPQDTRVLVRSIQRFDEDEVEAPAGSRVGVALKGIEADAIDRGCVLTADGAVVPVTAARLDPFQKVNLAKDPVEPGTRGLHLLAGTYARPVVVKDLDKGVHLKADRPFPLVSEERGCLAVLRGPGTLRLLGHGPIVP